MSAVVAALLGLLAVLLLPAAHGVVGGAAGDRAVGCEGCCCGAHVGNGDDGGGDSAPAEHDEGSCPVCKLIKANAHGASVGAGVEGTWWGVNALGRGRVGAGVLWVDRAWGVLSARGPPVGV